MSSRSAALSKVFVVLVVAGLAPQLAVASPRARVVPDRKVAPGAPLTGSVCSSGEIQCHAHVVITAAGEIEANAGPAPNGLGPADLQSAYQVNTNIATTPTVAIVDAYGYANLESDLGVYRTQYGLPPCTRANGCLRVLNQNGATAPLPPDPPATDDWTIETALDVDMASALCPKCKILVVQGDDNSSRGLYTAQVSAAQAGAAVISDSWGRATQVGEDLTTQEPYFNHPGIAQFFSAGDSGYNEGGRGPAYPSTSAHVIAVGGTALRRSTALRGWTETAWTLGGSSCSYSIPKPAHQSSPCTFRAASDIAAVGDPATGVAVYNANNGGWMVLGGTSAAAPIVAAIFASIGRGDITAAQLAQRQGALFDVTTGSNGPCGNVLCNAGTGWDGPTGYGTPNTAALAGGGGGGTGPGPITVTITSPTEGSLVKGGFKVTATVTGPATRVGFGIDGNLLQAVNAGGPYEFTAPSTVGFGPHVVQVAAIDAQSNGVEASVHVIVQLGGGGAGGLPDDDDDEGKAGCQAGSGPAGPISLALVLVVGLVVRRRRRA